MPFVRDIPGISAIPFSALAALTVTLSLSATHAIAVPIVSGPDANGFKWCTVGSPGNAAYPGHPSGLLAGRGRVDYEYRIARTEVSTAQWMEFLNAMGEAGLHTVVPDFSLPTYSGAREVGIRPNGSFI